MIDDLMQPSSEGSCLSVKSPGCGDAGESADEVPQLDSRTHGSTTTEKHSSDSSSLSSVSHSHSGVLKPPSGDDELLVSNSCPIADSNISQTTEIPEIPEDCISTISILPEVTNETFNNKKRKRESKENHVVQNGNIRQSEVRYRLQRKRKAVT